MTLQTLMASLNTPYGPDEIFNWWGCDMKICSFGGNNRYKWLQQGEILLLKLSKVAGIFSVMLEMYIRTRILWDLTKVIHLFVFSNSFYPGQDHCDLNDFSGYIWLGRILLGKGGVYQNSFKNWNWSEFLWESIGIGQNSFVIGWGWSKFLHKRDRQSG